MKLMLMTIINSMREGEEKNLKNKPQKKSLKTNLLRLLIIESPHLSRSMTLDYYDGEKLILMLGASIMAAQQPIILLFSPLLFFFFLACDDHHHNVML